MAYRSYNILKIYTYFVAMVVVGVGCAHNRDVKQAEGQERPTHYTLRLGEAAVHNEPLPSYTPIMIDWHDSPVWSRLGFKLGTLMAMVVLTWCSRPAAIVLAKPSLILTLMEPSTFARRTCEQSSLCACEGSRQFFERTEAQK